MDINSLFQELILDHYRRPRNRGELADARTVHMRNPTCGDEVHLHVLVDADGRITDAKFTGEGCSISQASISMMTELVKGRSAGEALALAGRFTEMMHGDAGAAKDKSLGDLRALAGVSKFPPRVKCALLGFDALQEALKDEDA